MAWRIVEIHEYAMTELDFTDNQMADLISYFDLDGPEGDEIREKIKYIYEKYHKISFYISFLFYKRYVLFKRRKI